MTDHIRQADGSKDEDPESLSTRSDQFVSPL